MSHNLFHGYTPISSGNHIYLERRRINSLLSKAVEKPIVSVVAGAGYGKTCAVYTFAKSINVRTAWIQVSQWDNLGEHFWENFVSAISIISGDMAEKLKAFGFPATAQQFERYLAIPRYDVIPNEKYLVVYDDVHLINDKTVLRFLEHRISAASPNISSVLLSRTDPALNMERMSAKNLVAKITEEELKFSQDEMNSYFRLQQITPNPRAASAIYNDTEGWAFAVHLAGLSLRNAAAGAAYVPQALRFNTSRLIESEIMVNITPELRKFLIKLSLIENLKADLVREIAKDDSLVKEMEGISSFIRFDAYPGSYYIHQLFLDYLKEKQGELSEEEKKEVWNKAALWCASHNQKMDAIINFEKTGDYGNIVKILDSLPQLLPVQMARFVLDILDRAPQSIYHDKPETIIIRNRILASLGLLEQSRAETLKALPKLEALPENPEKHHILSACYLNLGFGALSQSTYTRHYDFTDFFKEAAAEAKLAEFKPDPPGNGFIMSSYACRITAPASQEEMEKFISVIGEISPFTMEAMGGCLSGMYELCKGEFAFFKSELETAEKFLVAALEKSSETQQYEIENRALFYLLRIYLSRSDSAEINKVLKRLEAQLEDSFFLNRHYYCDIVLGWYYIQTGQKDRIASWLKNDFIESGLNYRVQGLEKIIKAKYCFAEKRYPVALAVMENSTDAESLLMGTIEMKVLEAACRYRLSDKGGAFKSLEDAYRLAEPTGLYMPFAELGKDMRTLLEMIIKDKKAETETTCLSLQWLEEIRRKATVYAKKLYLQIQAASENQDNAKGPLSRRETEVLVGLSQGLTREEIANTASISPNTVKSVVSSIYNKLGALNQADAVRIATERELLP